MPFLSKAEVRDMSAKYGMPFKGVVALDNIKQNDVVFICEPAKCMFYGYEDQHGKYTKDELNELLKTYPDSAEYIKTYSCMHADHVYNVPKHFKSKLVSEDCAYFNHSCDPNLVFTDAMPDCRVALRDIAAGEELTIHYGWFETEESLFAGLQCQCGSHSCSKILRFDFYKDAEWQQRFYQSCSTFIKMKIDKLRSK